MTPNTSTTPDRPQAPPQRRWVRRLASAVCRGFGGKALIIGAALKAVCALARYAIGSEPTPIAAADTLGSLALIVGLVCLAIRFIPRARRR